MSLPDLAAVLWRQREQLERLIYRLECEQLMLAAGRTARLALATTEVEGCLAELQVLELRRGEISDRVAQELGLRPGAGLEDLAAGAEPPWSGVLVEHRQALIALAAELSALAEVNRHLLTAGAQAVETALNSLGAPQGLAEKGVGYDRRGHADAPRGSGRMFLDRVV